MPADGQARELARLRWQCRRGMLELDEILGRYLDQRYLRASAREQEAFERLLRCQDPELQQWLLLGQEPEDAALGALLRVLRET